MIKPSSFYFYTDLMREYLISIDQLLTGHSRKDCEHTARSLKYSSFVNGGEYYLSDGGYSRLWIEYGGVEDTRLFLTSNSRKEVKAAWNSETVVILVHGLRSVLQAIYGCLLDDEGKASDYLKQRGSTNA